jgi:phosphoadenosine phosphosulfate reductase
MTVMTSWDAAIVRAPAGAREDVAETELARLRRLYSHLAAQPFLRSIVEQEFYGRIAAVSSFGAESAVILALIAEIDPATPVIFLDTGWHFAETIDYRARLAGLLGLTNVRSVTPAAADLQREDRDNRLHAGDPDRCCQIRKVLPLERALVGYEAWITGRKRYHGGERSRLDVIEEVDGRIKINPLAGWTQAQIAAEFRVRNLPLHPLVAQGYPSIGCAPCTSEAAANDGVRSGRWIDSEKIECGIHRAKWAQPAFNAEQDSAAIG